MGNSLPPPADIDLVDSFARQVGPQVELVLWEPKSTLVNASSTLVLAKGRTRVGGSVEIVQDATGNRLVCRARRRELTDGAWGVTMRSAEGDEPINARLLVQGDRPLVLLWGAKAGKSRTPSRTSRATRAKKRAASSAGHVLDAALAPLPAAQAVKARAAARKVARAVLR